MSAMSRAAGPERPSLEPGLLSAADVIAWRAQKANAPVSRLPDAAILTHQTSLLGRRHAWSRDALAKLLSFDVRRLGGRQRAVLLAGCRGVGAPATAVAVEELAAVGLRRLIAIDVAGSLDPALQSSSVVLIDAAMADDGTSPHYTADTRVHPNESLTAALAKALNGAGMPFTSGVVWSTDAVYRETPSLIHHARSDGAALVDMETASVLAVASRLGIEAAALLVVADELSGGWRPPDDMKAVETQLKRVLGAALDALMP